MSKQLMPFELGLSQCERDLTDFLQLLDQHEDLSEGWNVLPFFRSHPHLAALAGTWNAQIHVPDRLAFELDLFGNFRCDLAVGEWETQTYTLVEFEDARPNSVFGGGLKYNEEWGRRFEHGFSQLVDWFWSLDANRGVPDLARRFGRGHPQFFGMLVVGRSRYLADHEMDRLRWRLEKVPTDNHKITCGTFDQLHGFLARRIRSLRMIAEQDSPS